MYTAFIEVLLDLWDFVFSRQNPKDESVSTQLQIKETTPAQSKRTAEPFLESMLCYVKSENLLCLHTPAIQFDTVRGGFSYGETVRVFQQKDGWSFVETPQVKGWVQTEHLTQAQDEVFPVFVHQEQYSAANSHTKKLRLYLDDTLLGGRLGLPLQMTEYIFYRLQRMGKDILWPLERPRRAGAWHTILKDKKSVAVGLEPKTGSVLECSDSHEGNWLAYVESVAPDGILTISSVGRIKQGEYEKRECAKKEWQKWKVVFISFT